MRWWCKSPKTCAGDLLEPVLGDLGFGRSEIHANEFVYQNDQVVGLDPDFPLSRNGGKAEVLNRISRHAETTIIVGDGMTDFEAFEQGAADKFIGFGVIAQREVVLAAAEWAGESYVRRADRPRDRRRHNPAHRGFPIAGPRYWRRPH